MILEPDDLYMTNQSRNACKVSDQFVRVSEKYKIDSLSGVNDLRYTNEEIGQKFTKMVQGLLMVYEQL